MTGWLESVVGPDYAAALMWTIVGLIALLVLLILVRIVRGFGVGTFVAGGRNRKARLAVMDATAVDSHRRLVLVRRDDVEHLILIGGPTDVVVEQNIRLVASTRRQSVQDTPVQGMIAEQPRSQPQQAQPPMQPAPRPTPPAPPAVPPAAPPRPAPVIPAPAAPATVPSGQMKPHTPQPQTPPQAAPVTAKSEPDKTLDEEMSRLLNDLAGQR